MNRTTTVVLSAVVLSAAALWLSLAPVSPAADVPATVPSTQPSAEVWRFETQFGTGAQDVRKPDAPTTQAQITGRLDAPWQDDSGWADVSVNYTPLQEEGRSFVRVAVQQIRRGGVQMVVAPPGLEDAGTYTLAVVARTLRPTPVTIGVRDVSRPWRFAWKTTLTPQPSFETNRFTFRLDRAAQPRALYLMFDGVGELDLASIRVERVTPEVIEQTVAKTYPLGLPKNLSPVSRFPLGLPVGWTLGREDFEDVVDVKSVEDRAAPSGEGVALHLASKESFTVYSAPLPTPLVFDRHVLSLSVHGTGAPLKLELRAAQKTLASASVSPSADYSRVSLPFQPSLQSPGVTLVLSGSGEWWVDGLEVTRADASADTFAPVEGEVALASDSIARVNFLDEPAVVRYVAFARPGQTLHLSVVNAYGDRKELDPIAITDARITGTARYDVFPGRAIGSHRVEAYVTNAAGERVGPVSEIVVHRLPRPVFWDADAHASPFGVHTTPTDRQLTMAKSIGINWVRLHDAGGKYLGWSWLEPERGKWTFFDDAINRYRTHHLLILGDLETTPLWASYLEKPITPYFDRYCQPRDVADFANYVRVVVKRYQGVIDAYEVWNEPWLNAFFYVAHDRQRGAGQAAYVPGEHVREDYAKLTRAAYEAAKSVDPAVTIVGLNTSNNPASSRDRMGGKDWTQGFVDNGGLDLADVLSIHNYSAGDVGQIGDRVERDVDLAIGPAFDHAKAAGKPRPRVWLTEGQPVRDLIGNGLYRSTPADPFAPAENVRVTGERVVRFIASNLACGVDKLFLYGMHGYESFDKPGDWRVLVTPDGQLHPSGVALAVMAQRIEKRRLLKREVLGNTTAYLFQGDSDGVVLLLANGPDGLDPLTTLPNRTSVTDLFGNPPTTTDRPTLLWYEAPGEVSAILRSLEAQTKLHQDALATPQGAPSNDIRTQGQSPVVPTPAATVDKHSQERGEAVKEFKSTQADGAFPPKFRLPVGRAVAKRTPGLSVEPLEDRRLLSTWPLVNYTNVPIPDYSAATSTPGVATSSINVSGLQPLTKVRVSVCVQAGKDGDYIFTLVSPTGTRVKLADRVGGGGGNFGSNNSQPGLYTPKIQTLFDDAAASKISDTKNAPPYIANSNNRLAPYQPAQTLAALNGQSSNGTWTLEATDNAASNTGTIVGWQLLLDAPPVGTSATPAAPALNAGSDAGVSNSDRITNVNRSLVFTINGTISGANVVLLDDGNVIGSAVATGTSTRITTDSVTYLPDGVHHFTAYQTEWGKADSPATAATPVTIDTTPPVVSGLTVGSSAWGASFLAYLQSKNLGVGGYAIPAGANQTRALPWTNLDQLKLQFSEAVSTTQSMLALTGTAGGNVATSGFTYNSTALTGTWNLASALPSDQYLVKLTDSVTDVAGNALDGDWTTGQKSFPSGTGNGYGWFQFATSVNPGDVDRSGKVDSADASAANALVGATTASPNYSIFADVDGSGSIDAQDVGAVNNRLNAATPASAPASVLGAASFDETQITTTYYVNNSTGNDANTGTTASSAYVTITKALTAAVAKKNANQGVKVLIAPGTYREGNPANYYALNYTLQSNSAPLIIQAADWNPANPSNTGGVVITGADNYTGGWTQDAGGNWTHAWNYAFGIPGWTAGFTVSDAFVRNEGVWVDNHPYYQVNPPGYTNQTVYGGTASIPADANGARLTSTEGSFWVVDAVLNADGSVQTPGSITIKPAASVAATLNPNTSDVQVTTRRGLLQLTSNSLSAAPNNIVLRDLTFTRAGAIETLILNQNNLLVQDCAFSQGKHVGFQVKGSRNVTLQRIDCSSNGELGAQVSGSSVNVLLDGCTFTDNARQAEILNYLGWSTSGIKLFYTTNVSFVGCAASGNRGAGFWLDSKNDSCTLTDCVSTGNASWGLFIESNHSIDNDYSVNTGPTIQGPDGIPNLGSRTDVTVTRCVFTNNRAIAGTEAYRVRKGVGVFIAENENAIIDSCLIYDNDMQFGTWDGTRADMRNFVIRNCVIGATSTGQRLYAVYGDVNSSAMLSLVNWDKVELKVIPGAWYGLLDALSATTNDNAYFYPSATAFLSRDQRWNQASWTTTALPSQTLAQWQAGNTDKNGQTFAQRGVDSRSTLTVGAYNTALPLVGIMSNVAYVAKTDTPATVFTVTRVSGNDYSTPLTVNYTVRNNAGDVVMGTDVQPLSGSVTIPAGARSASITVTPLKSSLNGQVKTLSLSINSAAGYLLGKSSASTLVADTVLDALTAGGASASPGNVTGTTTTLVATGFGPANDKYLTYTWQKTTGPGVVGISANGTNTAKNTVVTFGASGAYGFLVTATDPLGQSAQATVNVTVASTATQLNVTPTGASVAPGATLQFNATALDQFNSPMSVNWSVTSGTGSISASGLFTASSYTGLSTVTASVGSLVSNTVVEITTLPAPLAWYRFEGTSTSTSADSSVNGFGGTPTSTGTSFTTGPAGQALALDGTAGAVSLGNPAGLNVVGQITLSAWVNPKSSAGTQYILGRSSLSSPMAQTMLRINAGQYQIGTYNGSNYFASYTVPAGDLNTWVFLTGVYDGSAWRLYRNGALVSSFTTTVGAVTVPKNWMIGAGDGIGRYFNGSVDDVRIYNTGLNSTNAQKLYNSYFGPTVATPAGASPSIITGTAGNLAVRGASPAGEGTLIYTWATSTDSPGPVSFGANGTNAAKNTTATFGTSGTYDLFVTISDAFGRATASHVVVTVSPSNSGSITQNAVAPSLGTTSVNGGSAQRAKVTGLSLAFDQPVTLASNAVVLTLRSATGGAPTTVSGYVLASTDGGQSWQVSFPASAGFAAGSLGDGVYDLKLSAVGVTSVSSGLQPAGDRSFSFHRLFGDVNGDAIVNNYDYLLFSRAFGASVGAGAFNAAFDFNGDGVIDNFDYLQFSRRFGSDLTSVL